MVQLLVLSQALKKSNGCLSIFDIIVLTTWFISCKCQFLKLSRSENIVKGNLLIIVYIIFFSNCICDNIFTHVCRCIIIFYPKIENLKPIFLI